MTYILTLIYTLLLTPRVIEAFAITSSSTTTAAPFQRTRLSNLQSSASTDWDVSGIPYKEGTVQVSRGNESFNLSYKLFRPMNLSSRQAAPLVVLHGGPSVPSDYLLPLAKVVPYRSILFYDQLGCGASDEPKDASLYSIEAAVDDLEAVLQKLSIRRYHLYGQSFGGILAFEFLKRQAMSKDAHDGDEGCLSLVLSSSPTNVRLVENEAQRLIEALESPELFRETHQCRTETMPQPLQDAYAKAGTVWRGTTAISDYVASPPPLDGAATMPSALVLRGEHDFVTEITARWKDLLNSRSVRERVLDSCSHHGLLESPPMYGEIIESFVSEYD